MRTCRVRLLRLEFAMSPTSQLFKVSLLFLMAIGWAAANPAHGQTKPQKGAKIADSAPPDLEKTPFEAENLGLTIKIPVGSNVVAQKVEQQTILLVSDDPTTPTWTLRVQPLISTQENPTAAGQIQSLLNEFATTKQKHRVISNAPFSAGPLLGQLCYVEQTGGDDQKFIAGWLLLPSGENQFMVFFLQTLPEHFERVRPLLEASFATIKLKSVDEIAAAKLARLDAGRAFLASVTPERLKALVGQSQWHRIYKPADPNTGESQEIGYSFVEVREAKRGALNEQNDERAYSKAEHELGLLVRLQARVVIDAQRKHYYDSIANYWMRWDQTEEVWSIRATRRQGAEQSEAEMGVREAQTTGSPLPRLTVVKRTDQTEPVSYEWPVPDVYLPQTLGWLMGKLLPREGKQQREFAYYFFVSSSLTPKVYQRIDTWSPAKDGSGNWTLATQLTSDTPPYMSVYGPDGRLLRRTHADGTITEPIDFTELQRIWKSRGMQIGSTGR